VIPSVSPWNRPGAKPRAMRAHPMTTAVTTSLECITVPSYPASLDQGKPASARSPGKHNEVRGNAGPFLVGVLIVAAIIIVGIAAGDD